MTQTAAASPEDVTAVEIHGRLPLLFLLGAGLLWLVLGGLLALISGFQLHDPAFLAACPVLSHGRVAALAESALVYGWLANAGLGLSLWILGRLGGGPLRASNWIGVGALFWNTAVLLGLGAIAKGGATAIPLFEMPRDVQMLMVIAYAAIGVGGVLAWTGRRRPVMYASQWYAVAGLFLFPWLSCAAQALLASGHARGVLQAVVAGWYEQGVWSLWLSPLVLAAAYYVVPKSTGKILPAYDFAPLGFWCLLFVGAWTGGRHLIGGPVPAWISSVAIVASALLLFHYVIVAINLRSGGGTVALRFISLGLAAYVLGGFVAAATSLHAVSALTQFTYFDEAERQLAFSGAASLIFFGAIYYALPRLTGRPWAWGGLVRAHFGLAVLGTVLLVAALAGAGLAQGNDLNNPAFSFAMVAADTRSWLLAASAGQALLLLGNFLLLVNFIKSAACPVYAAAFAAQPFRPAGASA
ncbi:MAG TPA: cbb3-type cytochrome c oxidase subunit I [Opitutaceae bacterium]|jgi:cytochrome c oxidase cbb3-type subunit 1|nr:cbb3-type cytochrome c oxidase subunit I [Opitutaceae bacterium]